MLFRRDIPIVLMGLELMRRGSVIVLDCRICCTRFSEPPSVLNSEVLFTVLKHNNIGDKF